MRIIIPHATNAAHLEAVKGQMQQLGRPTIKAVWDETYGSWVAIEGSHRVTAAVELGIEPIIDDISEASRDAELAELGSDIDIVGKTLGEWVDAAWQRPTIEFNDQPTRWS